MVVGMACVHINMAVNRRILHFVSFVQHPWKRSTVRNFTFHDTRATLKFLRRNLRLLLLIQNKKDVLIFRAFRFFAKLIIFGKDAEWRNLNVPKVFAKTVEKMPDKTMFYFEDQIWTFKQVSYKGFILFRGKNLIYAINMYF